MVDIFALSLPHALLLVAIWRLLRRDDLDQEGEAPPPRHQGPRGPESLRD